MKLLACLLLLGSTFLPANNNLPQIVCRDARGNPFPLKLDRFAMEVELFGDLAETTFTLTFRNETNRQLEGDFLLPLPPHANISGYALEVKGQFREAVAVEKNRARLAYETIKSRGIDPGIVEKEGDNLYRTRIFPIERNSTKSLRISYLEYLSIDGHPPFKPRYRYPINLTSEVGEISLRIKNPAGASIQCKGMEFLKSGKDALEARLTNSSLTGELTIESATRHQASALLFQSGYPHLTYLTFNKETVPDWGGSPLEPFGPKWDIPKKIKILWDSSRSMTGTDYGKTFQYFDAFFSKIESAEVQLHLLRNTEVKIGEYQIMDGDWSPIRNALEAVEYDGSSHLQGMGGVYQDFTILVTDGLATRWPNGIGNTTLESPLIALTTTEQPDVILRNLAQRSGGHVIPVNTTATKLALRKTFQKVFHLRSTQRRVELIPLPSQPPFVYRYLAKGGTIDLDQLEIAVGENSLQKPAFQARKAPKRILQRLSGIATLEVLEKRHTPPSEIIAHCKKHTLASDHTSLIVLERFEDHLAFQIPPPEHNLRRKYEQRLAENRQQLNHSLAQVWAQVLTRHRHQYPGIESIIFEDLRRIRIHNEAQERVFAQNQLDKRVTQAFRNWESEAEALIAKRAQNQMNDDWIRQAVQLRNKVGELRDLRAAKKAPLAVSIRGFVRNNGTLTFDEPVTLTQALAHSAPHTKAGYAAVSFYRSGHKIIYNTLSKNFQDFQLLPGDMIVVHDSNFRHQLGRAQSDGFGGFSDFSFEGSEDPFSSDIAAEDLDDYSSEPAVIPTPLAQPPPQPITLGLPATGASLNGGVQADSLSLDPVLIAIHSLQLFKEEKREEAERHLSNLRELFPGSSSARRLEAYVLLQWGEVAAAQKILTALLKENPSDHLSVKLSVDRHLASDNSRTAERIFRDYFFNLKSRTDFAAATILMLDRNQLLDNPSGIADRSELPKDLRIVVTNIHPDPTFRLSISDPTGFVTHEQELSPTGVANHIAVGLHEITVREALKGSYTLSARCDRAQLLELAIYRNFSTEQEEVTRKSIILPATSEGQTQLLDMVRIDK